MATVTPPPSVIPPRVARTRTDIRRARRSRQRHWKPETIELLLVMAVCFVAYLALGWRVVHDQHVIIFDATARLAHAYFVFWNQPPKLASIGFVWAPVSTLVFLPFVLLKPLGTSLIALTATSGAFAAMMIGVLVRAMTYLGLPRWQRLTLVALFAVNPMILFYAVNGMSEAPFMALLTVGIYFFIRWYLEEDTPHWLVPASVFLTLAFLCRYEVLGYAAAIALAVPITLMVRRRSQDEVEGSTLAMWVPMLYGLGLWVFFNWLIIGDPLFWLQQQIGVGGGTSSLPVLTSAAAPTAAGASTKLDLMRQAFEVNARMFPLVLILVVPLLAHFAYSLRSSVSATVHKNGLMSLWMALLVSVNLLTTLMLLVKATDPNLLQLRYNMRSLPVAMLGLAWLWYVMPGKRSRLAVWAVGIAVLAGTLPLTWNAMNTWPVQYEENIFTQALATGKDQEGADPGGPYTVGNADDREMAAWIQKHVPQTRDTILTDDGQTFGVMLATGHPDLFRDRIDRGDANWKRTLNAPWGRVRYLLVARYPLPPAGIVDEIQKRYPGVRTLSLPGVSVEHQNPHYVLLRVSPRRPTARPSRFDQMVEDAKDTITPRL